MLLELAGESSPLFFTFISNLKEVKEGISIVIEVCPILIEESFISTEVIWGEVLKIFNSELANLLDFVRVSDCPNKYEKLKIKVEQNKNWKNIKNLLKNFIFFIKFHLI